MNQAQNEEIKGLTEASYDQNEEVKRVSAWAAIVFAPTLIGTVYGMNFVYMPELGGPSGYPFALALMLLSSVTLWLIFRREGLALKRPLAPPALTWARGSPASRPWRLGG